VSIHEVKATIRRGNDAARLGVEILRQAESDAEEAGSLARHTLHDSQNEDVQAGLELLASIEGEVERTTRCFERAVDRAEAYVKSLG
jgi:hypothetical protein